MFGNRFALLLVLAGLGWLCLSVDARRREHADPIGSDDHDIWWKHLSSTRRPIKLKTAGFPDHRGQKDRAVFYGRRSGQEETGEHSDQHSDQPELSLPADETGRGLACDNYYYTCLTIDGRDVGRICVVFTKDWGSFPPRCVEKVRDPAKLVYRCQQEVNSRSTGIEYTGVKC